ncbi:alpha/beta hydrolase [Actinotalea sp. AC32]|nr:alpha/beta hydrolase [Actinotalea sp. AC32]
MTAAPLVTRVVPAVLLAASAAVALGVVMPRGPMTTGQSVVALLVALGVGAAAGVLARSRWAALGAPVAYALVFELVRLGTEGPTVDRIRFDSIFATGAMIAGRGFDLVVVLVPMAVAALLGAAWARRRAGVVVGSRAWRVVRRTGLTGATLAVVVLAAALVRPASTEAILGADGERLAGSVAELVTIEVGGHAQSLMIRGADADAPVLLFLEGGPGGTAVGSMRYAGEPLEQDFVVATWDQRGTGRSADELAPVGTMTVEQMVSDAVEVVDHLRERFDEDRVYVVGSSWGTTLGVLVAQRRPDLVHAYVGAGQMVSQAATDQLMYDESLAYATRSGDAAFERTLRDIGRPPYDDPLAYPLALSSNPEWSDFEPGADHEWRASYPTSVFVAEYTLTEQVRSIAGLYETFAALYPQLLGIDFRRDVPRLDVPVLLVEGEHEARGRAVLAQEWFAGLEAPSKELVTFDSSGHTPHLDEPGRFADLMAELKARTYPG